MGSCYVIYILLKRLAHNNSVYIGILNKGDCMDGPDISSTPNPNAQPSFQPVSAPPPSSVPAPGQVEYDQNASTIETDKQLIEELFLAMQFPGLYPPNLIMQDLTDLIAKGDSQSIAALTSGSAIKKLEVMYEETKHDIINHIWDNFIKSVRELEELSKEAYIKKWVEEVAKDGPKSSTEYFAFLLALSSSQRAEELSSNGDQGQSALSVQFKTLFNQWFSIPSDDSIAASHNSTTARDAIDPSFKIGALASNLDVMSEAIALVGVIGVPQLSVSPLADALSAVGPNSGLPVDSQAAAALIAALLYNGARNRADVETLEKAASQGRPPQDIDFAANFARIILTIVSHGLEGETSASKEQSGQHQLIRLMLSVMALNLLYRAGYGGMEGSKEFAALLEKGGTDNIDPAIKPTIDQLVARIKEFLPTDEPARSQMIASLSEYIDSKDSTESMLSTSRMFAAALGARPDIFGGRLGATSA